MNLETFYQTLTERSKTHGFELVTAYGNKQIREKRTGKCPVCAVVTKLKGRSSQTDAWRDGEKIGLNEKTIENIISASDCGEAHKDSVKRIRNKMVKLLNLGA